MLLHVFLVFLSNTVYNNLIFNVEIYSKALFSSSTSRTVVLVRKNRRKKKSSRNIMSGSTCAVSYMYVHTVYRTLNIYTRSMVFTALLLLIVVQKETHTYISIVDSVWIRCAGFQSSACFWRGWPLG